MNKKNLFAAASVVAIMFGTNAVAQDATFSLVNNSDHELITLQTSGSNDPSWGPDVLTDTAAPGATINVSIGSLEECEYDVRATYDDGDEETLWNIDLCEADSLEFEDDDADEPDPEGDEDEDEEDDGEDEDEEEDEEDEEEDEEDEEEDEEDEEEEEEDEEEEEEDEEEEDEEEEEEEEEDEEEEEEEEEEEAEEEE